MINDNSELGNIILHIRTTWMASHGHQDHTLAASAERSLSMLRHLVDTWMFIGGIEQGWGSHHPQKIKQLRYQSIHTHTQVHPSSRQTNTKQLKQQTPTRTKPFPTRWSQPQWICTITFNHRTAQAKTIKIQTTNSQCQTHNTTLVAHHKWISLS